MGALNLRLTSRADAVADLYILELADTIWGQAVDANCVTVRELVFSLSKERRTFKRIVININADSLLIKVEKQVNVVPFVRLVLLQHIL